MVRDNVIALRSGFKNAAREKENIAIGALNLAEKLGIITKDEAKDGRSWVRAEYNAKIIGKGDYDSEKYENSAIQLCWEFDRHFQQ